MGNRDSPDKSDSQQSKQRTGKSVRWTEKDIHHDHITRTDAEEDYFTYAGGSANRSQRPSSSSSSSSTPVEEHSSSSDNSSDDDENDVNAQKIRASTRANTWFNRLRKGDDDRESHDIEGLESNDDHYFPDHSRSLHGDESQSFIPSIRVSEHTSGIESTSAIQPYSNLMDIGTKVSAGLAPGGRELSKEDLDDPLDKEYRERRNQLLGNLEVSTSSPHSEMPDPMDTPDPVNANAIPLVSIKKSTSESDLSNSYRSKSFNRDNVAESCVAPSHHSSLSKEDQSDPAAEAEALKARLQATQSLHLKNLDKVLAARKRREATAVSHKHNCSESGDNPNKNDDIDMDVSSVDSSSIESSKNTSEEELRRLEILAREEAEAQAKLLVKSHLSSHLLSSNTNNDGYVENNRYLLDAGLVDDDIPLIDEDISRHSEEYSKKSHLNEKHNIDESLNSSDTLNNDSKDEKKVVSDSSDNESGVESKNDDKLNRHITMRGDPDYVPPPKMIKEGVLGSILRLYAGQEDDYKSSSSLYSSASPAASPLHTPPINSPQYSPGHESATNGQNLHPNSVPSDGLSSATKRWKRPEYFRTRSSEDVVDSERKNRPKWFKRPSSSNMYTLGKLASTAGGVASTAASTIASSAHILNNSGNEKGSSGTKSDKKAHNDFGAMKDKEARKQAKKMEQKRKEKEKLLKKARLAEQARITIHIADVLQRQRFLLRLGRALMLFGAPSHRLEEYLKVTARVLEIDAQVLYMPGCMLVSFGDATTHTSETKLLKVVQGLNLNKLHATHIIYKEVVHDLMSIEEASSHIDHLLRSRNLYPWYIVCIFYGLATVCCGMFAYGAHWKDMPIIFVLGGGVGFLQYWVQPKSDLYANIFEVSSSIVVSFLGRAFGSIWPKNPIFCFSAIVQASLALILPGYIILVGALELQSKNLVAGSVRMFYANIYSLFLSFGITLGSAIYGWIDKNAITETTCRPPSIDAKWKILFVPMATLFMATVNQAGPRQLPIMVILGSAGYAVQYFVQRKVKNANAFTSAIGAFTLGVGGNLYSRVGHGLAFAAMLPGIFVLVPSGVAAQGSLVAGVRVAEEIVKSNNSTRTDGNSASMSINQLGNAMTQVAVGIVVGLFAATLVVYPLGFKKKRSGLFTF